MSNDDQSSRERHTPDPRFAAFLILEDVLQREQTLEQAETARIDPVMVSRDRGFCRHLVYGCLRHLGEIDTLKRRFLKRAPTGRGRAVETIVRLGLTQILFSDVPPYAAVDKTVEICRVARLGGFTKLVNAIMRRAADEAPALHARRDDRARNTPKWLREAWETAYGGEAAGAIGDAHAGEPPLDLVVAKPDEQLHWAQVLDAEPLFGSVLRRPSTGVVHDLPGFESGAWWVQDAAAILPVSLLGDIAGQHVADLCAAPGGKTLQLAAGGAIVSAIDRSANRLTRLTENLQRTGLEANVTTANALDWRPAAPLDAVLLDAPCSATGTIRRHPDIPWIRTSADVAKLAELQTRLLRHAVGLVKPGGLIVYCTCSLQPEEGEAQIERLLAETTEVERAAITDAELPDSLATEGVITAAGDLRTLPSMLAAKGGLDGFYAARLRRRA